MVWCMIARILGGLMVALGGLQVVVAMIGVRDIEGDLAAIRLGVIGAVWLWCGRWAIEVSAEPRPDHEPKPGRFDGGWRPRSIPSDRGPTQPATDDELAAAEAERFQRAGGRG